MNEQINKIPIAYLEAALATTIIEQRSRDFWVSPTFKSDIRATIEEVLKRSLEGETIEIDYST